MGRRNPSGLKHPGVSMAPAAQPGCKSLCSWRADARSCLTHEGRGGIGEAIPRPPSPCSLPAVVIGTDRKSKGGDAARTPHRYSIHLSLPCIETWVPEGLPTPDPSIQPLRKASQAIIPGPCWTARPQGATSPDASRKRQTHPEVLFRLMWDPEHSYLCPTGGVRAGLRPVPPSPPPPAAL